MRTTQPSARGGNATVPVDAPIMPPQAFVDNIAAILHAITQNASSLHVFAGKGFTKIDTSLLDDAFALTGTGMDIDMSGCALPQTNINAILAWYTQDADHRTIGNVGTIDLSGGANAAPTSGVVNPDAWTLAANGWQTYFNVHNVLVQVKAQSDGSLTGYATGNQLSTSEVNAILAFLSTNYLTSGGVSPTIDLSGGTSVAPSGQGLTDKAALIAAGWTVTTN